MQRKTTKVLHPNLRILVLLTIIICIIEAFTKGWASFYLVPFSLVALPIYGFYAYESLRITAGDNLKWIRLSCLAASVAILSLYVCTVGFGDTDDVLLFGFYTSNVDSIITHISDVMSHVAFISTLLTLFLLVGLIRENTTSKRISAK